MEWGSGGMMGRGSVRKNENRGYKQLRVWADAVQLYVLTCRVFRKSPHDLKRVPSRENKRDTGDWIDRLVVSESNAIYGTD